MNDDFPTLYAEAERAVERAKLLLGEKAPETQVEELAVALMRRRESRWPKRRSCWERLFGRSPV